MAVKSKGKKPAAAKPAQQKQKPIKKEPEAPKKAVKRKAEVKKEPAAAKGGDDDDEGLHNTVFVSHIFNVKNDVLTEYFAKAGEIHSIRNLARKGYAFIRFNEAASVEKALAMDGQDWNGKNIIVQAAKSKKSDAKKRKNEEKQAGPKAKKAKAGGKIVSLKTAGPKQKGGKPKTPQQSNPNKKKNKPKPGAFVKAT
ncbi:hypothetical protein quinque_011448 [Culex quinquefasciatus]